LVYKIQYLPIALKDLKEIVKYITHELEAPRAAEKFLKKIDNEVLKIAKNPFRCHIFSLSGKLKNEYRFLHINNYSLFYIVERNKVEIHRIVYSRRDILFNNK